MDDSEVPDIFEREMVDRVVGNDSPILLRFLLYNHFNVSILNEINRELDYNVCSVYQHISKVSVSV